MLPAPRGPMGEQTKKRCEGIISPAADPGDPAATLLSRSSGHVHVTTSIEVKDVHFQSTGPSANQGPGDRKCLTEVTSCVASSA